MNKKQPFVEIFETKYGTDVQCGICGGSVEFVDCPHCDEGYNHHDCGEDTCCCLDPEPNVTCDVCNGEGGWYHCFTCETNTNKVVKI